MLNPSTADEQKLDPTLRRCRSFSKAWGVGGMLIVNLFAFRSTDPAVLRKIHDPRGADNDRHIRDAHFGSHKTIVAWGAHGDMHDRAREVKDLLWLGDVAGEPKSVYHLGGLTKAGHPRHPLYLPGGASLNEFKP